MFYPCIITANPDNDGMVGLCASFLATDVGKCSYEELDDVNYYACRALDNILSLTKYPFKALEDIGKKYRSIGIGVTNLAYFHGEEWCYLLFRRRT